MHRTTEFSAADFDLFKIVKLIYRPRFIPKPPTLEDWANTPSNVTILSKKNFRKFMKKHDQVVVMFYAKCEFAFCAF